MNPPVLSKRQREVCELVTQGCANKSIAARLGIGLSGVKRHVEKLFSKLDVNSRAGLAVAFWSARGGRMTSGLYGHLFKATPKAETDCEMKAIEQTVQTFERAVLADIYQREGISIDDRSTETLLGKIAVMNRALGSVHPNDVSRLKGIRRAIANQPEVLL